MSIHDKEPDFVKIEDGGQKVYGYKDINTKWFEDKSNIHFIIMMNPPRPGGLLFSTVLEYKFYPPRTRKNEEFIFHIIRWESMVYAVVSIPMKDKHIAEAVCKKTGMRIADGIPTLLIGGEKKAKQFPIRGENAFSIENEPDHPMYKSVAHREAFLAREQQLCQIIQQHGDKVVDDVLNQMKGD